MSGIPFINFSNLENWLMITEGMTLIILLLIVFFFGRVLRKGKNKKPSVWTSDQLIKWAKESEILCLSLSKNLEEKKEITKRLMEQLDEKLQSLNLRLAGIEEKKKSIPEGVREGDPYGKVVKMVEAGYKFPEIVRSLKLPKGEVQLILDLKQYSQ
ncbi:MAG: hypothetical protein ABSB32_02425 [Thermodesulfobacteriota bacterium]|jgi:hypothetical protein